MSEERKRKSRTDEGDERFSKKSKGGESDTKKFDVTEEELGMFSLWVLPYEEMETNSNPSFAEAYRRTRSMGEDPMANYVDEDL